MKRDGTIIWLKWKKADSVIINYPNCQRILLYKERAMYIGKKNPFL